MNLLILGGTIFLGKHIVNAAIENGHTVTLFNRGQHNPEWFPDLEKIKGDRDGDLSGLKGRKFDGVIDTCGYIPRIVRKSAEFLKDSTGHYTFISSISVYNNDDVPGSNENSETGVITDDNVEKMTMENYGPLKVLCENEVMDVFGENSSIVRSGLIVGDGDFSDRFTYWIHRISKGGKVIVPVSKINNVQFIDVKDLAEWTLKLTEEKISGVFNSTGPLEALSLNTFVNKCKEFSGSDAEFIYMDEKFLLDEGVIPYQDLTLWLPEDSFGMNNVDISKAKNAGLKIRPLEKTLKDTAEYDLTRGPDFKLRTGLSDEKEKELLEKWESR
ncbi:MAG TPA: epimerase [Ignavibacteria bacterium]|nr:epimerase [Ignavibacteria bacterium]HQY53376.1 epimerase [Ignavibacteria bacterium]HRB01405.1 epimerase [Ignavibacteria bacterium]